MSDRMAVVVALATVAGAVLGRGPSPWLGVVLVASALLARRPVALAAAAFVLAGGLAARADAGLAPVVPGPFAGTVTMLADPQPISGGGVRFDVRLADGRHVEAVARAPATVTALRDRAAGQRLVVRGRLHHVPPGSGSLRARHVSGELSVDDVPAWSPGGLLSRAANGVRSALTRGASVLPARQRPLFLGFVLGDTRGQPPDVADDFRGSGLSHLLAVSGENVAFVLALAGPVLRRLSLPTRFVATLGVIAFFALVTRFEPSVLRASAMAAIAVTAVTLGREASRARVLALAVAGLVVVDPFLVRTVGFQLSVAACAGIVTVTPAIERALPGPRSIASALSVTIGAQAGVAPLLVTVFGGVPLATIPSNLLAAPAAAAVMVWGVGAGLPAGLTNDAAATMLHLPTRLLIGWIAGVAGWGASLPLGELGGRELVVVATGVALITGAGRLGRPGHGRGRARLVGAAGAAAIASALVMPSLSFHSADDGRFELGPGATLWRAGGATVVELDGRARASTVLENLRRAGARDLDLVVVRTPAKTGIDVVTTLRGWGHVHRVVTPAGVTAAGSTSVVVETELSIGALHVAITPEAGRLVVDVARGPPV